MTDESRSGYAGLSRVMAALSMIAAVLLPVGQAVGYLFPGKINRLEVDNLGTALNESVPLLYRLAALAFALVATGFLVWALLSLRRLFLLYAAGEVFTAPPLKALNNVATGLLASVVVGFAMHGPITFILSWPFAGHRSISLDLGSGDFATLFCAGAVLVIARVMREAGRLADENAKFI
ncbi:MAG TPA: DUF2975 domain-containing protein [Rhizomicrobium sp.]|jgi:hypothetical protein|nr:DUF2975 domain-containing protein [Rhizomicrobium sp.]